MTTIQTLDELAHESEIEAEVIRAVSFMPPAKARDFLLRVALRIGHAADGVRTVTIGADTARALFLEEVEEPQPPLALSGGPNGSTVSTSPSFRVAQSRILKTAHELLEAVQEADPLMTPLPTPRNKTQFLIQFVRTNPPMRKKDLLEKTAVLLNSTKYRMASLLWNTLGVKGPLEELEDTTIVPMEQSALLRGARANQ